MREDTVLAPGDEHDGELEALGVVQGHERHGVQFVLEPVDVGDERHRPEELLDPLQPPEIRPVGVAVAHRARLLELGGGRDELLQVLLTTQRLDRAFAAHHVHVAGGVENRLQRRPRPFLGSLPEEVDERDELADRLLGPRREPAVVVGPAQRFEEPDPVRFGVPIDVTDTGVADGALGDVDDPAHRHGVVRVHHDLQVGEDVLHFATVVELHAAYDLIGDAELDEQLLDDAALGVRPVEDGDVAQLHAALLERRDLLRDERRLVLLVLRLEEVDELTLAGVGPQPLRLAAGVVGDDGVGGVEDRLGRAVVLLEQDDLGVRVVLLELVDVADVGAPKCVDRLVGVVGVLVLVDQHVAEPLLVVLEDCRERLEQLHGQHDDVVEIHRGGLHEPLLVEPVRVGHLLVIEAGAVLLEGLEVDQLVLRVGDGRLDLTGRKPLRIHVEVADAQGDEAQRVGLVVDGEG